MNNWAVIAQSQQTAGKQTDLDQRDDPPNPEAATTTPTGIYCSSPVKQHNESSNDLHGPKVLEQTVKFSQNKIKMWRPCQLCEAMPRHHVAYFDD